VPASILPRRGSSQQQPNCHLESGPTAGAASPRPDSLPDSAGGVPAACVTYKVTRDQAKNAYQVLTYGGSVNTWAQLHGLHLPDGGQLLRPFRRELKDVRARLLAHPISKDARKAYDEWPPPEVDASRDKKASLFSYLIFEYENRTL
jgi:hypothetical protein